MRRSKRAFFGRWIDGVTGNEVVGCVGPVLGGSGSRGGFCTFPISLPSYVHLIPTVVFQVLTVR